MVYEVIFSEKAEDQLKKLEKNIQERIISVLERIKVRPELYAVKLIGDRGYKLRVGDYRLILDIDKNKLMILVIKLGQRRNIYKH